MIEATTHQGRRTLALIRKRGLTAFFVGTKGAVRVIGPGVDVMAVHIDRIEPRDLIPYRVPEGVRV